MRYKYNYKLYAANWVPKQEEELILTPDAELRKLISEQAADCRADYWRTVAKRNNRFRPRTPFRK